MQSLIILTVLFTTFLTVCTPKVLATPTTSPSRPTLPPDPLLPTNHSDSSFDMSTSALIRVAIATRRSLALGTRYNHLYGRIADATNRLFEEIDSRGSTGAMSLTEEGDATLYVQAIQDLALKLFSGAKEAENAIMRYAVDTQAAEEVVRIAMSRQRPVVAWRAAQASVAAARNVEPLEATMRGLGAILEEVASRVIPGFSMEDMME